MRGYLFLLVFISSLPLIFVSPFNGVLIWYAFSLGNFHTLTWGFLNDLYYAYIIGILTCISWMFSRTDKKQLPLVPLVVLTLLFSVWMTITSCFALAPAEDVWDRWLTVHKVLLMCFAGFALTTTRERLNQLIWVVVLAIGIWGVKGTISVILHGGSVGRGIHGPDGGVMSDNNAFGLTLIMILPLLFYLWHGAVNRHLRRGLVVMGFLISLAVIFTYSRGAFLGLCGMAAVFWLKSRAKVATGGLIVVVGLAIYGFTPQSWFDRMATIQEYEKDGSAMSRIDLWKISLRIAELRPVFGGGFKVTYWPTITNRMLEGTNIKRFNIPRAVHSIWFDALSEHGWPGLTLYLMIAGYSWLTCSWLLRRTRDRPELAWANLLGRMGQAVLVGFWAAGSFASFAYYDVYWCIMFILASARRLVAEEIESPTRALVGRPSVGLLPARAVLSPQTISRG
jgi:probable O-glycosylation ligase (exosortase A-associated)